MCYDHAPCVDDSLAGYFFIILQAQVFFLDYGNSEIIKITNLYPLPQKFEVYTFQMKQCCFCEDTELVYGREVCDVGGISHYMVLVRGSTCTDYGEFRNHTVIKARMFTSHFSTLPQRVVH